MSTKKKHTATKNQDANQVSIRDAICVNSKNSRLRFVLPHEIAEREYKRFQSRLGYYRDDSLEAGEYAFKYLQLEPKSNSDGTPTQEAVALYRSMKGFECQVAEARRDVEAFKIIPNQYLDLPSFWGYKTYEDWYSAVADHWNNHVHLKVNRDEIIEKLTAKEWDTFDVNKAFKPREIAALKALKSEVVNTPDLKKDVEKRLVIKLDSNSISHLVGASSPLQALYGLVKTLGNKKGYRLTVKGKAFVDTNFIEKTQ